MLGEGKLQEIQLSLFSLFPLDSLRRTYTSVPQWLCCVALMFREHRASAVVVTWPIMKWRSSCFCPILSRCSTASPARSPSSTRPVANRCQVSKVCISFYFWLDFFFSAKPNCGEIFGCVHIEYIHNVYLCSYKTVWLRIFF